MSVRMRINRAATGNRRSSHGLKEPRVSVCSHCGALHLRHRMCSGCGHYKGRLVIDVAVKAQKKALKQEARRKEMGEKTKEDKDEEEKEASNLSPEKLSK